MTTQIDLTLADSHGDKATFTKSVLTGYAYVAVNDSMQVRLLEPQRQELIDFLTEAPDDSVEVPVQKLDPDVGMFYILRQRKDNPLKIKVIFAGTHSTKLYTSRAKAKAGQKRMTELHGDKFNFFVVEAV